MIHNSLHYMTVTISKLGEGVEQTMYRQALAFLMAHFIYDSTLLCILWCSHATLVTPHTRCRLKLLKLERIKDFLLMEEELVQNLELLKPQEQKHEVGDY